LRSDTEQAVSLMSHAKELAGEHWSFDSEETLQEYLRGN